MWVGYSGRIGYYMDSNFKILYSFNLLMFETAQDIEIYNGYGFMITSELGIGKYQKNNSATFDILMNQGNPKLASRYARRIIEDNMKLSPADIAPGTKVYELVEELAKYLPENEKAKFI